MANPFQYSCLEHSMAKGARQARVHGVAQSRTRLKRLSMHTTRVFPPSFAASELLYVNATSSFFSTNSLCVCLTSDTCLALGILSLPPQSLQTLKTYTDKQNSCRL